MPWFVLNKIRHETILAVNDNQIEMKTTFCVWHVCCLEHCISIRRLGVLIQNEIAITMEDKNNRVIHTHIYYRLIIIN